MPKLDMSHREYIPFKELFNDLQDGDYLYCFGYIYKNGPEDLQEYPQEIIEEFEYICLVTDTSDRETIGEIIVFDIWDTGGVDNLEGYWNMDEETLKFYQKFVKI